MRQKFRCKQKLWSVNKIISALFSYCFFFLMRFFSMGAFFRVRFFPVCFFPVWLFPVRFFPVRFFPRTGKNKGLILGGQRELVLDVRWKK